MIAYEDLVSALAMWRERNGLPVGAADYLGEPPAPEPVSFAAYESRPAREGGDDVDVDVDLDSSDAAFVEDIPMEAVADEAAAGYDEWSDPVPVDDQLAGEPADEEPPAEEPPAEDLTADPWGADDDQPTEPPAGDFTEQPPADEDPWAAQAAEVGVELPPDDGEVAEAPVSYDEYPAVGEATMHEPSMAEQAAAQAAADQAGDQVEDEYPSFADEQPPAADEMSFDDLVDAQPGAADSFEPAADLGAEPSTVDEDVAVISSSAPSADELPPLPQAYEADSTAPVDPVAEPIGEEVGEETQVGMPAPDNDEPPQS